MLKSGLYLFPLGPPRPREGGWRPPGYIRAWRLVTAARDPIVSSRRPIRSVLPFSFPVWTVLPIRQISSCVSRSHLVGLGIIPASRTVRCPVCSQSSRRIQRSLSTGVLPVARRFILLLIIR